MITSPNGVRLTDSQIKQAVDYKGRPYKLTCPDEEFYSVPGYEHLYVSQYASVISTKKHNGLPPHQLKPYYDSKRGYYILRPCINGKPTTVRLHILVALVWCEKPKFAVDAGMELEVHHRTKVLKNRNHQPYCVQCATNLMWIPKKYHKRIDSIRRLEVQDGRTTTRMVSVDAIAQYYNGSEQSVYELLITKPEQIAKYIQKHEATLPTLDGSTRQVSIIVQLNYKKRKRKH